MGSLLIVTGPPGAGKSTVGAALARLPERSMLVEGDAFFDFVAAGFVEPWLPESAEQNRAVTRAAGAATGELCRSYDTIYDGVLGPWFLSTFLEAGRIEAADYAVLLPSVESCVSRVRSRREHDFTDIDATEHMHRQFADAGVADRHVIDSTDLDAAATVDLVVAARAAGSLRLRGAGSDGPDPVDDEDHRDRPETGA